jgi:heme/copper-type cytochrome/quinol oxidase subunit 2
VSAVVVVFILCAAGCLVGQLAILQAVIRKRFVPSEPGVPRPRVFAEVIWALVPAIALAFVLTATWQRVRDHAEHSHEVMKVAR